MKENDDVRARFVLLRERLGHTQDKIGKLLGITDVSVSRMESGVTPIGEKHIKLISGVLGISEDWLRDGKGLMLKDGKVPDEDTMLEMYRALSMEGRKLVMDYIKLILKNEKVMRGEIETEKGEAIGIGQGDSGKAG